MFVNLSEEANEISAAGGDGVTSDLVQRVNAKLSADLPRNLLSVGCRPSMPRTVSEMNQERYYTTFCLFQNQNSNES